MIAGLLRRLRLKPPPGHGFRPLSDMCDYWASRYEREPWLAIDPKPYVGDPAYDVTQHIFTGVFIEGAGAGALAARMACLLDLDLNRIQRWLFARAVEASPYWAGMADLARTLYPLGGRFFGE